MDDFDARRASLDLVTAFVNNNTLSADQLPALLRDVFSAISGFGAKPSSAPEPHIDAPVAAIGEPAQTLVNRPSSGGDNKVRSNAAAKVAGSSTPAISVSESLADPAVIVSLITGEKFKTLKRHLAKHGFTAAQYKARFNLPDDYPMVAPAYAEVRRKIALERNFNGNQTQLARPLAAAPVPDVRPVAALPSERQSKSATADSGSKARRAPKLAKRSEKQPSSQAAATPPPANADKDAGYTSEARPGQGQAEPNSEANRRILRTEQSVAKAPLGRPAKTRRMARPAATDPAPQVDVATAPSGPEATVPTTNLQAPVTGPTAISTPSGGAPPSGGEIFAAKSARKERKKLSVKFG